MIFITGDTHGSFERLFYLQKTEPGLTKNDFLIICGDFGGVWKNDPEDSCENKLLDDLEKKLSFSLLFVDGNHENFARLYSYPVEKWNGGKVHKLRPHILHLMRGEIYLIDDKRIFCFGGAASHDIEAGILDPKDPTYSSRKKKLEFQGLPYRIKNKDWWEQELPTFHELKNGMYNLEKHNFSVDYIVSHSLPSSLQKTFFRRGYATNHLTNFFDEILSKVNYRKWYCGHYHTNKKLDKNVTVILDEIHEITTLDDILEGFQKGRFSTKNGQELVFKNPLTMLKQAESILDVYTLFDRLESKETRKNGTVEVWYCDTLEAANRTQKEHVPFISPGVLSFANGKQAGGCVRKFGRALAQEEALCLKTSLLLSLESKDASSFYVEQQEAQFQGSDAILYSPYVECIDEKTCTTFDIQVFSAVAPQVSFITKRLEDMSDSDMDQLWERRILSLLAAMVEKGSSHIILGAWGCGAYANDPKRVAKCFQKVLYEYNVKKFFDVIIFAVINKENFEIFQDALTRMP